MSSSTGGGSGQDFFLTSKSSGLDPPDTTSEDDLISGLTDPTGSLAAMREITKTLASLQETLGEMDAKEFLAKEKARHNGKEWPVVDKEDYQVDPGSLMAESSASMADPNATGGAGSGNSVAAVLLKSNEMSTGDGHELLSVYDLTQELTQSAPLEIGSLGEFSEKIEQVDRTLQLYDTHLGELLFKDPDKPEMYAADNAKNNESGVPYKLVLSTAKHPAPGAAAAAAGGGGGAGAAGGRLMGSSGIYTQLGADFNKKSEERMLREEKGGNSNIKGEGRGGSGNNLAEDGGLSGREGRGGGGGGGGNSQQQQLRTFTMVEYASFPGFLEKDLTPLPGILESHAVLYSVLEACLRQKQYRQQMGNSQRKMNEWGDNFTSDASKGVLQDAFWWVFLKKFHPDQKIQDKLFTRLCDSYISLFTLVGKDKDSFFRLYPNALAQALFSTFCHAFPKSGKAFGDPFKEYLCDLTFAWCNGGKPIKKFYQQWNLAKLQPKNMLKEFFTLEEATGGVANSTVMAQNQNQQGGGDFIAGISGPDQRSAGVRPLESNTQTNTNTGTALVPFFNNDSIYSGGAASSQQQQHQPKLLKEVPTARMLFDLRGHCPLIAHYLKVHRIKGEFTPQSVNRTVLRTTNPANNSSTANNPNIAAGSITAGPSSPPVAAPPPLGSTATNLAMVPTGSDMSNNIISTQSTNTAGPVLTSQPAPITANPAAGAAANSNLPGGVSLSAFAQESAQQSKTKRAAYAKQLKTSLKEKVMNHKQLQFSLQELEFKKSELLQSEEKRKKLVEKLLESSLRINPGAAGPGPQIETVSAEITSSSK
eukprot:Nk52_evm44s266 gene=Nk52_evmTU44s266